MWSASLVDESGFEQFRPKVHGVSVFLNGRPLTLQIKSNLAAALLGFGVTPFCRNASCDEFRAPFCMTGHCYDCRVLINGVERRACCESVREGMRIELAFGQSGDPSDAI
ncbi:(2Fe-2S)-binding protein [Shimia sp. R11_0]|uniref:2Fe-2S iron-sulfur cluster-binding protein n=1 Tax=Shimia sp. R11_0 TaxID=2821096 RepID=UPI001ADAFB4A|nr:2Fe-2S iron-sulfur cluster-binding protein [Shimia sp. R11_0]MBO9476590.1 (2Fe-2S)-binding protein [Shimia sp. R11_0]